MFKWGHSGTHHGSSSYCHRVLSVWNIRTSLLPQLRYENSHECIKKQVCCESRQSRMRFVLLWTWLLLGFFYFVLETICVLMTVAIIFPFGRLFIFYQERSPLLLSPRISSLCRPLPSLLIIDDFLIECQHPPPPRLFPWPNNGL